MGEPEYIAQTFEADNCRDGEAKRNWFKARMEDARERGLRYPRFTIDHGGLLIEVWRERWPQDQGEPRWSFAPDPSP